MQVRYSYRSRFSGLVLSQALADVDGPSINWGYPRGGELNRNQAVQLASNKRMALYTMLKAGVPIPAIFFTVEFDSGLAVFNIESALKAGKPFIGRPDSHKAGSGFYFCRTIKGVRRAIRKGATHFLEFIPDAREFRVHIVNGKSIKIAEKLGGGNRRNFNHGAYFAYPDFDHKKSLRRVAKQAVMSLGLDFGAVDLLYKDGQFYVLEVNTAPALTSASDVLERYVTAFKEEYGQKHE